MSSSSSRLSCLSCPVGLVCLVCLSVSWLRLLGSGCRGQSAPGKHQALRVHPRFRAASRRPRRGIMGRWRAPGTAGSPALRCCLAQASPRHHRQEACNARFGRRFAGAPRPPRPRAPRRQGAGVPGLAAKPWPVPLLASAVHKWVPGLAAIPKARALAGQCLFRAVPAAVVGAFSRARPCRRSSSPRFLTLLVGHVSALLVATGRVLLAAFFAAKRG